MFHNYEVDTVANYIVRRFMQTISLGLVHCRRPNEKRILNIV